jgi:hypothetical protein
MVMQQIFVMKGFEPGMKVYATPSLLLIDYWYYLQFMIFTILSLKQNASRCSNLFKKNPTFEKDLRF